MAQRDALYVARNSPGKGALPLIDRPEIVREFGCAIRNGGLVVLLGDSGVGKSALLAQLRLEDTVFYRLSLAELAEEHSLWLSDGDSLSGLLDAHTGPCAVLVVDGVEWLLNEDDGRPLRDFISSAGIGDGGSTWRLVLSCTTPHWSRVRERLGVAQDCLIVELPIFTRDQINSLENELPALAHLLRRRRLARLFGNARVLRWMAEAASGGRPLPDAANLVGEAGLIEWLWDHLSDEDPAFAPALEEFARDQASRRLRRVPEADLDPSSRPTVSRLVERGILHRERSTIRLVHDLLGDYGRQRWLLGQLDAGLEPDLAGMASNVLWHRAIRLVGLHLMEVGPLDDGQLSYEDLLDESSGFDDPTTQDLLLESVAFSVDPAPLLSRVESVLLADSAELLRRFLVRFRHSTSIPDPRVNEVASSASSSLRLAASWRLPEGMLWKPIIHWLVGLPRAVRRDLAHQIVDLADMWLLPPSWGFDLPFARELEVVVLDLVEDTREFSYRFESDLDERLMRSMLRGGKHQLSRWREVVRQLSGLNEPVQDAEQGEPRRGSPVFFRRETVPKTAWGIGPLQNGDEAFRNSVLAQPGATFLVQTDPSVAVEVFLAVLVEPPGHREVGHSLTRYVDIGFRSFLRLEPPFHTFAPARTLLEQAESEGLRFTKLLVEFATQRWLDQWRARSAGQENGPAFELSIKGELRRYPGDSRVYSWARAGVDANDAVKASLMAVEQWLYEKAESAPADLPALIEQLLGWESASVLGVLCDLAQKTPSLLGGPLECLVTCEWIHLSSTSRALLDDALTSAMIPWSWPYPRHGVERAQEAQAWYAQTHRTRYFTHLTAQMLANRNRDWPVLHAAVGRWRGIAEHLEEGSRKRLDLEQLIATLDAETWVRVVDDQGAEGWRPVLPAHVEQKNAERAQLAEAALLWLQIPDVCFKVLVGQAQVDAGGLEAIRDWVETGCQDAERERLGRCALAAVLLTTADEAWWEAKHDLQERCVEWLVDGLGLNITPDGIGSWQPKMDSSMVRLFPVRAYSTAVFQSLAMPRLWSRAQDDHGLRAAMACLAMGDNQEAVELFFKVAFLEVGCLDDGFRRLVHIAVRYARLCNEAFEDRRKVSWSQYDESSPPAISRMSEIVAYARTLVSEFIDGRLSPVPDDWLPVREAELAGPATAGVQGAYLVAAFGWLWNALELAAGPARTWALAQLVALQREVWARVTPRLRVPQKAWQHHREHPLESDREVARIAANWFHTEPDPGARSSLVSLWLDAPQGTSDWLELFVTRVFDGFFTGGTDTEARGALLDEFLQLSLGRLDEAPVMGLMKGLRDPQSLIGCPPFIELQARWTKDQVPLSSVLVPYLGAWAHEFIGHHSATRSFLRLLRTDAMDAARAQLLVLLCEVGVSKLRRRDCGSEVAFLLERTWSVNAREIRRGSQREAFDTLLAFALQEQVPEAMELADRVAAGRRSQ